MHVDGVDAGQQNGEIIKEIKKGSRRKQLYLVPGAEHHAQQERNGKKGHGGKRITARRAAPLRQGENIERVFVAGKIDHPGEADVPEKRKQAAKRRHKRQQIQK